MTLAGKQFASLTKAKAKGGAFEPVQVARAADEQASASTEGQEAEEDPAIGAVGLILRRLTNADGAARFRVMSVGPGR